MTRKVHVRRAALAALLAVLATGPAYADPIGDAISTAETAAAAVYATAQRAAGSACTPRIDAGGFEPSELPRAWNHDSYIDQKLNIHFTWHAETRAVVRCSSQTLACTYITDQAIVSPGVEDSTVPSESDPNVACAESLYKGNGRAIGVNDLDVIYYGKAVSIPNSSVDAGARGPVTAVITRHAAWGRSHVTGKYVPLKCVDLTWAVQATPEGPVFAPYEVFGVEIYTHEEPCPMMDAPKP